MATRAQLETALRNADAKAKQGDQRAAEAARRFAAELKAMRSAPEKTMDELTPGISTNPTDGMSTSDRAWAGAGEVFANMPAGMAQAWATFNPVAQVTARLPMPGEMENPLARFNTELVQRADETAMRDKPLMDTRAGFWGNIGGNVLSILGPGTTTALAKNTPQLSRFSPQLGAATRALLPTTVRGSAAQGAALGAIEPVGTDDSRLKNTAIGAVGGTAGGVLPLLVGGTLRAANRAIEPFYEAGRERIVGRAIQRSATDPNSLLNLKPDPVTGTSPTLAEATLDPGIAQLQRSAMSLSPDVASAIWGARNAANDARVGLLSRFAGTPAARESAMDAVRTAEQGAYQQLDKMRGVDIAPVLSKIETILGGREGKRSAVRDALGQVRRVLFADADQTIPETDVSRLIGARQEIGDIISGKGDSKGGPLAKAQLIEVRDALDAAIRRVAGGKLDEALDARRIGMRPVNEMDAVTEVLEKGTKDVISPDGQTVRPWLQPSAFNRIAADLDLAAQRGTGFRGATAEGTFSPEAAEAIQGVRLGVLRQEAADNAARVPGSPTAQYMAGQNVTEGLLGPRIGQTGPLADAVTGILGSVLDKPYLLAGVPQRLNTTMARVLANPAQAPAILAKLPRADRILIEQAIARGTATPGAQFGLLTAPAGQD